MARRLALGVLLLALVATAPAAGDVIQRKAAVDQRIQRLHDRIDYERAQEGVLTTKISAITGRIRTLALAEERDRALAALKELEFDHRTGKVSDEDYRRLVGPLRAAAAEALRALEPTGRVRMVEVPDPPEPAPPEPVPDPVPEPYPPPDEADPPQPAIVPEPGPVRIPEPGPR